MWNIKIVISLGSFLLAAQYFFARRHALPIILETLQAQPPDPTDDYHVRFANIVEEMRIAAGLRESVQPMVSQLVCVNAFAAADTRHGAIVGVTEGLLAKLNREQLQAVVAHEIAHIRSGDAALTTLVCSMLVPFVQLYESASMSREALQTPQAGAKNSITLAEAYLGFVLLVMRLVATMVERGRELRADAEAVELTRNPIALAEAIWIVSRENHFVGDDMIGGVYAPIFISDPSSSALSEKDGLFAELFSTHPPTTRRLAPLLTMANFTLREMVERLEIKREAREAILGEAAEDRPFAANVIEPAQIAQLNQCPTCATMLRADRWAGVRIASCPACGGVLVEQDKLVRVLSRTSWRANAVDMSEAIAFFSKHYLRREKPEVVDPRPARACPQCGMAMMRAYFNYQYNIVVDRCFVCKLVWFDHGELETLYQLQKVIRI